MQYLVHTFILLLIQGIYLIVNNPTLLFDLYPKLILIFLFLRILNFKTKEYTFLIDTQYITCYLILIYYFWISKPILFTIIWIFSIQLSFSMLFTFRKFNFQNQFESLNTFLFLLPLYFCFCLRWFIENEEEKKKISEMGMNLFQVFPSIFWSNLISFIQIILYSEIFKALGIKKTQNSFHIWIKKFKIFFEEYFEIQYEFLTGYWNLFFPGDYTIIFSTIFYFLFHEFCCFLSMSLIWNFNFHLFYFLFIHLVLIYNTIF